MNMRARQPCAPAIPTRRAPRCAPISQQVLDYLLFATEEQAVAEARISAQGKRRRYARSTADRTTTPLQLHADRLLPAEPAVRAHRARPVRHGRRLPIISPHGHTDPAWFAGNAPFANATELLLHPGPLCVPHALQPGHRARALGVGNPASAIRARAGGCSPGTITCFAARRRGSGSTGCSPKLRARVSSRAETADHYYDTIAAALATDRLPPARAVRALQHRGHRHHRVPLDTLEHHRRDPR